MVSCVVLLALSLGLGLGLGLGSKHPHHYPTSPSKHSKPPNVLVVMTDDQDLLLDSMSVMPNVNKLIGEEGVTYSKHYCTVAWCCPSRVNFLTGRAAHNTNVTSTRPPYGGWQKFSKQGLNENYLPVWINNTGISTYYVGKFMNGYSTKEFDKPAFPKGWTDSSFLVDPFTYNYYHSRWTNGYTDQITPFIGTHTTDVTKAKALQMLDQAATSGNQFFMMVAPVAPHQELLHGTRPPPVPEKWRGTFNNRQTPRTENFNPDVPSGASWVYDMPKLSEKDLHTCDKTYDHRLGNIAAIDDMVASFIQKLEDNDMLDNTYVVYTTDNGFHIGNHRLLPGKRCPWEEDINIPLLIRGPDVAKGVQTNITNSHTDMAPTILQMLGVEQRAEFDGAPVAYTPQALSNSTRHEHVNVEFWDAGGNSPIGLPAGAYFNNTYKTLRIMSSTDSSSFYYSTWCTGEREFYDMRTDPQQMNNKLGQHAKGDAVEYYGRPQQELINRLDALLMVTKSCKQEACREPWGPLFPSGEVYTLQAAMNSTYDRFFASQPKISFSSCYSGNIIADQGPQHVIAYR